MWSSTRIRTRVRHPCPTPGSFVMNPNRSDTEDTEDEHTQQHRDSQPSKKKTRGPSRGLKYKTRVQDTEDEHTEQQRDSQPSKKRRTRGPSRGLKYKTGVQKTLEWDETETPTGEWADAFITYTSNLVRSKVSINTRDWRQVPKELKDQLFEGLQREFTLSDDSRSTVMKILGKMLKDFRCRLVTGYITKTRKLGQNATVPYIDYEGMVSYEDWVKFVAEHEEENFKKRSEMSKAAVAQNLHPHFLGRSGYYRKRSTWMAGGLYDSVSSYAIPSTSIVPSASSGISSEPDRSANWLLARAKLDKEGKLTWPNKKTLEVKEKIDKYREEVHSGNFVPDRNNDILTQSLEKLDHPGRVIGVGGHVGIRRVFGKCERRASIEERMKKMEEEMEKRVTENIEKRMKENMQKELDQRMAQFEQQMMALKSQFTPITLHPSPSLQAESMHSVEPNSQSRFQEVKSCKLGLQFEDGVRIVATGYVYQTDPSSIIHHAPIGSRNFKVSVTTIFRGCESLTLPAPTEDYTRIADAQDSFVQWPMHLVILDGEDLQLNEGGTENKEPDKEKIDPESHSQCGTGMKLSQYTPPTIISKRNTKRKR